MFIPFLALLAFWQWRGVIKSVYGFILGLLVSLYFWLPALTESKLMKYDTVYNYWDQFPSLKQLISPYFGYGGSNPGQNLVGMSFFIGLVNLLLVVFSFLIIIFSWRKINRVVRVILVWALATFFIAFFMMNYRSIFVWRIIPYLSYFQFPWRFLSLTTFATSILVVIFDKVKFGKIIGIIIIIGAILLNFTDFKPHDFLGRTDEYYLNRYIPYPVASAEYLKTGEEYLRLPLATEIRPDKVSPNPGLDAAFNIDNKSETVFNYYKYYFPGWEVKVDGSKTQIMAGKPYGQILFNIASGKHFVEIAFKETPFRKILDILSLLGLAIAVTISLRRK
jgi:hypothetical protein